MSGWFDGANVLNFLWHVQEAEDVLKLGWFTMHMVKDCLVKIHEVVRKRVLIWSCQIAVVIFPQASRTKILHFSVHVRACSALGRNSLSIALVRTRQPVRVRLTDSDGSRKASRHKYPSVRLRRSEEDSGFAGQRQVLLFWSAQGQNINPHIPCKALVPAQKHSLEFTSVCRCQRGRLKKGSCPNFLIALCSLLQSACSMCVKHTRTSLMTV